jgi:hypothetical protein
MPSLSAEGAHFMSKLLLALGFVSTFSLATWLQPRFAAMHGNQSENQSALAAMMGDSRRLFAQQFFVKADAYFHSGAYPGIFDAKSGDTNKAPEVDMADAAHGQGESDAELGHESSYLGRSDDWIEKLGRNFFPTIHTHLDKPGQAREIMPWLKLSAELDPQKVNAYVTASYWLRHDPKHADEAEPFLREGLRANPDSYEILLELGKYYGENKKDPVRARNLFELAWAKWQQQKAAEKKPDELMGSEILGELVRNARQTGDTQRQLHYLELLKPLATDKESVQKQIDALNAGPK